MIAVSIGQHALLTAAHRHPHRSIYISSPTISYCAHRHCSPPFHSVRMRTECSSPLYSVSMLTAIAQRHSIWYACLPTFTHAHRRRWKSTTIGEHAHRMLTACPPSNHNTSLGQKSLVLSLILILASVSLPPVETEGA